MSSFSFVSKECIYKYFISNSDVLKQGQCKISKLKRTPNQPKHNHAKIWSNSLHLFQISVATPSTSCSFPDRQLINEVIAIIDINVCWNWGYDVFWDHMREFPQICQQVSVLQLTVSPSSQKWPFEWLYLCCNSIFIGENDCFSCRLQCRSFWIEEVFSHSCKILL